MYLMSQIKLIVSDLDGTLLNDKKEMDSNIKELIKLLRLQGIYFTIATGRNFNLTKGIIKELDISLPYICNNGGSFYQKDKCIKINQIEKEYIKNIIVCLKKYNIPFIVYGLNSIYTNNLSEKLEYFVNNIKEIRRTNILEEICDEKIIKITVDSLDFDNFELIVNDVKKITSSINFNKSENSLYTITDANATKGKGLIYICNLLNINLNSVMSIGDNYNDYSLLDNSKVKVCMKDSQEELKNISDLIIGSNNENGVSQFLKQYFDI